MICKELMAALHTSQVLSSNQRKLPQPKQDSLVPAMYSTALMRKAQAAGNAVNNYFAVALQAIHSQIQSQPQQDPIPVFEAELRNLFMALYNSKYGPDSVPGYFEDEFENDVVDDAFEVFYKFVWNLTNKPTSEGFGKKFF